MQNICVLHMQNVLHIIYIHIYIYIYIYAFVCIHSYM